MTLLELKTFVNKLSDRQLMASLFVLDKHFGIGRPVLTAEFSKADLYGPGFWEEGIPLRTKSECTKDGIKGEEFDELEVFISKGDLVFKF